MFPAGNSDCGNLQFTWQSYSGYVPNTGYNGQLLLNELTRLITPISNEESDLAANNIGLNRAGQSGVIFDLNTQKSQIQTTQQRLSAMKTYLQGVVNGVNGSTCFYTDAPQWRSCGPYAQYLISNFLTPLQTLLNKDTDYTNATYNLIYNAANTLGATLNGSTCDEI